MSQRPLLSKKLSATPRMLPTASRFPLFGIGTWPVYTGSGPLGYGGGVHIAVDNTRVDVDLVTVKDVRVRMIDSVLVVVTVAGLIVFVLDMVLHGVVIVAIGSTLVNVLVEVTVLAKELSAKS